MFVLLRSQLAYQLTEQREVLAFATDSDRGESRLSSFPSAPTVQTLSLTAFLLVLLSFVRVCEGAKSIAEVLAEPADVTPSHAPSGRKRRPNHSGFEESFCAGPSSRLEISTRERRGEVWEEEDGRLPGPAEVFFTPSVVSLSRLLLCQEKLAKSPIVHSS